MRWHLASEKRRERQSRHGVVLAVSPMPDDVRPYLWWVRRRALWITGELHELIVPQLLHAVISLQELFG